MIFDMFNDRGGSRTILLSCVLACLFMLPTVGEAQFLRLTFEIESELEAEVLQSLNFGEVVPQAGRINIPLGDPDMGTYSITGMQNLMVDLALDKPDYLELEGEEDFRVPMDLQFAYANRNQNNIDHAIPIETGRARFPIRADAPSQQSPDQPAPSATAFLYVYGFIEVGDIPPGTYDAEVFLVVEYE